MPRRGIDGAHRTGRAGSPGKRRHRSAPIAPGLLIAFALLAGPIPLVGELPAGAGPTQGPVLGAAGPATGLSVRIGASPAAGTAPLGVHFLASTIGGRAPFSYRWSFGGSRIARSAAPVHTFDFAGSYYVTLVLTDSQGVVARANVTVGVRPAPAALRASIGVGSPAVSSPRVVPFTGRASGGTPPYSYRWTFGDGSGSRLARPAHRYATTGRYSVSLTVTDASGRTASNSVAIVVGGSPPSSLGRLVVGRSVARTASSFWSIDAQTSCATCIASSPALDKYLASTPFRWVRYGAGTDACDLATDTQYSDSGVATHGCWYNVTALKSWCAATGPTCHTILSLPGENNDSAEDAAIAKYVVQTLGFQPSYWSIGNEPTGWTHYGIPWTRWRSSDASTPTPLAYAVDVRGAIQAVRAVDPAAKFIGIEAACSCNGGWFTDVGRIDGALLGAVAYHLYPSDGSTSPSLRAFYAPLAGTNNISGSYASVRNALVAGCPKCADLPIFINEYNAGPGWTPSARAGSYANAVFVAASVAEALRANVSQFTIFNLQTGSAGYGYSLVDRAVVPSAVGRLFETAMPRLAIGQVLACSILGGPGGVYDVLTENATSETLLVVNTNLTRSLTLSSLGSFPTSIRGTVLSWVVGAAAPSVASGLVKLSYTVGPEGILLVTAPRTL